MSAKACYREMKRREVKQPPSTDLLVCFPTISHLPLMPKTICSPSKTSNPQNNGHPHNNHPGKSTGGGGSWSKTNQRGPEWSEPTSPKVTCAGQIKHRPKSGPCKNWQSAMDEIERLHDSKKHTKKPNWVVAMALKKESMQFLTALRGFKFDLGCFGAFPAAGVVTTDDDNDDEEEISHEKKLLMGFGGHDRQEDLDGYENGSSRKAFSKWFMGLEENQDCGLLRKQQNKEAKNDDEARPPSNALLLMRCHSAPTKSWLEEREEDDHDYEHADGMRRENLMEFTKYEDDFYKLSCDIAKETWVVGGINEDPFSVSQSSKRCSTKCLQEVRACLQ